MKPQDYARKWITEGKTSKSLFEIMQSFFCEIADLLKDWKKDESLSLVISAYQEIDTKFRVFAELFPGEFNLEGLRLLLLKQNPSLRTIHHLIWPDQELPPIPPTALHRVQATGPDGEIAMFMISAGGLRDLIRDAIYQGVRASQKIEGEPVGPYDPPPSSSVPDNLLTT